MQRLETRIRNHVLPGLNGKPMIHCFPQECKGFGALPPVRGQACEVVHGHCSQRMVGTEDAALNTERLSHQALSFGVVAFLAENAGKIAHTS